MLREHYLYRWGGSDQVIAGDRWLAGVRAMVTGEWQRAGMFGGVSWDGSLCGVSWDESDQVIAGRWLVAAIGEDSLAYVNLLYYQKIIKIWVIFIWILTERV